MNYALSMSQPMGAFSGYLSKVTTGGAEERHVAYQLAHVGQPATAAHDRRFDMDRLDDMIDPALGDTYSLHSAFVAEKTYLEADKRTKETRQGVADAYVHAGGKLKAAGAVLLASQCIVAASIYDTTGKRQELAQDAARHLLAADLGKSDAAATRWAAVSILRVRKECGGDLVEKLHGHYLDALAASSGEQNPMNHHSKSALELASTESQRTAVYREHVRGLEKAAEQHGAAMMKDHFLEEAVKTCTHLLQDHGEARRLQGLRSKLDLLPEMAVFEHKLDLEKPIEDLRTRLKGILHEARPEDGPQGVMTCLVHGFAAPPASMPTPDAKRKPTLMDQLGIGPVIYSETEKTQKRPKQPMMQAVRLERSIAYQIFQYQAVATMEILVEPLLVRLHVLLVEYSVAEEVPDWMLKLRPVVKAYLDADYYTAGSMGCIAIESVMRDAWLAGGKVPQYYRDESSHNSILSGLLQDPVAEGVLGTRLVRMARYMLDDEDGPNLRNVLVHGIADPRKVGYSTATAILHLLLAVLSAVLRFERGAGEGKPAGPAAVEPSDEDAEE